MTNHRLAGRQTGCVVVHSIISFNYDNFPKLWAVFDLTAILSTFLVDLLQCRFGIIVGWSVLQILNNYRDDEIPVLLNDFPENQIWVPGLNLNWKNKTSTRNWALSLQSVAYLKMEIPTLTWSLKHLKLNNWISRQFNKTEWSFWCTRSSVVNCWSVDGLLDLKSNIQLDWQDPSHSTESSEWKINRLLFLC